MAEGKGEASKVRYQERVKNLEKEELIYVRELMEILELNSLSHENLSSRLCMDWLKTLEVHFFEKEHCR